ncbi:MAG: haloalkane dehalogenase 2 [Chitinophagales bacterium]|nr:MAG: haloalkane dehalogenase 2 [Chitinophagales bacterium]
MNWIDRNEYPFTSHYFDSGRGRIHYVDEGSGPVVLMVHGTPEWSFAYRHLIKGLRGSFRCIAPDLLGFGLSDKPADADYSCAAHADRLCRFIDYLGLKDIRLIANDFGGSLAMSYAINHPDNVSRICLFNTWMWSLAADKHYSRPARFFASLPGRWLYLYMGWSVNVLMPLAYGNKSRLTSHIHRHYKKPLHSPVTRLAAHAFVRELLHAGPWWDQLFARIDAVKTKPFLIFWGMQDPLIKPSELARWQNALPSTTVIKYDSAGHFVQEEEPEKMIIALRKFLP